MKHPYCCRQIEKYLADKRVPIKYNKVIREYYFSLFNSFLTQDIQYCPWCGTKFPKNLSDVYSDILEKEYDVLFDYDFDDIQSNENVPSEFKSDEWWKKRNLE